ncbi:MAG: ATP synthase F1 subunit epsilon [Christensenellaceae bacterium]|jgi:F-type H+-transporting ATPase subunit epsilon|nr:ATP synthase F1 subunit epsilon [Christensenellaceae bacterium]
MSRPFPLEILTPEYQFFAGEVEALTITGVEGELTVLCGHTPMIAPLTVGTIQIKQDGAWRAAFQSEGFLEVDSEGAHLFVQACEWPETIDVRRAEESRRKAQEKLRQSQNMIEYHASQMSLARAMMRLRITRQSRGY